MNRRTIRRIILVALGIPALLVTYGATLLLAFGTGLYIAIQVLG